MVKEKYEHLKSEGFDEVDLRYQVVIDGTEDF